MTKNEFKTLFNRVLILAAEKAESREGIILPRIFMISLQAFGNSGDLLTCDQAIDQIYIGENKFFRVIDIAITAVSSKYSVAFVRVSGHPPGAFADTFAPKELGPFNILMAEKIDKLKE